MTLPHLPRPEDPMTLTEFLLARIAEDEAAARAVLDTHEMWDWESFIADAGHYDEAPSEYAERMTPKRALAECEAKRRIVERCAPITLPPADIPAPGRAALDAQNVLNRATLRVLAAPYADHPDYRDEWRP